MDSDLFSFLDAKNGHQDAPDDTGTKKSKRRKRKQAAAAEQDDTPVDPIPEDGEALTQADAQKNALNGDEVASLEPALKKARLDEPQPVVVDEFETEAKREVAADAGLTGGDVTGASILLTHQVSAYRLPFYAAVLKLLLILPE